ncbi:glycosyltransferase family protein [Vibrio campbellii]|uniref:hypothetical protein n=1 Tax=Vibrio campbellii TaxID=680 RepID=UPI00168CDF80|nr:hypothetical protein [Vibrio campbellii]
MKSKAFFVGQFSNKETNASSPAGDIVQKQILKSFGEDVFFVSLSPTPIWPKGPFFVKGKSAPRGKFISFLNFPIIKNIIFSFNIMVYVFKIKPKQTVIYNSYFFENLILLIIKSLKLSKIVCILQDYRIVGNFSFRAKLNDKIASYLLRFFDIVVPVSYELANSLGISGEKVITFQGGVTEFGYSAFSCKTFSGDYAVYAGALEKHNGVDRLIYKWNELNIQKKLHIFGKGSLLSEVEEIANRNHNIIFHGLVSQETVLEWQNNAKYNFCFRFSEGLAQEYFFPSKFFNVAMCPGLLVCNSFHGVPDSVKSSLGLIDDDLNDLAEVMNLSDSDIYANSERVRSDIITNYSWDSLISTIKNRF